VITIDFNHNLERPTSATTVRQNQANVNASQNNYNIRLLAKRDRNRTSEMHRTTFVVVLAMPRQSRDATSIELCKDIVVVVPVFCTVYVLD